MAKLKQTERVLRHLRDFGSLTALEAMSDYGIMHLASRIDELRKGGWPIQTVPVKGVNRYGEKTTYARYVLLARHMREPQGEAAK